ncbi:hypothetical protein B0T20DRAFT_432220 [Sordaria brevicollis]|uniref:Uncharacterized protein n=1 Tax=Sordaria brevicollis TaxID=83679 RepID=A0AAE0UFM7_SORBR|nr:hypothetical protein B0T20DRAFT_432220 [Sordaria brevicollis]
MPQTQDLLVANNESDSDPPSPSPFPFPHPPPPELRLLILSHLLTSPSPNPRGTTHPSTSMLLPHSTPPPTIPHHTLHPLLTLSAPIHHTYRSLTLTSPSISRQASHIYYGTNTFLLDLSPRHRAWLVRIRRRNSFLLRTLTIRCFQAHGREVLDLWIGKVVMMGQTVVKRCRELRELRLDFGALATFPGGHWTPVLARECVRMFVEDEAVRGAWRLRRLGKLRRVVVCVNNEWEHTEGLVGLLTRLVEPRGGMVKKGVVVEGRYVVTVRRGMVPGAAPEVPGAQPAATHLTFADQERRFFEGRYNRATNTLQTQQFQWEEPQGWPMIYRQGVLHP